MERRNWAVGNPDIGAERSQVLSIEVHGKPTLQFQNACYLPTHCEFGRLEVLLRVQSSRSRIGWVFRVTLTQAAVNPAPLIGHASTIRLAAACPLATQANSGDGIA
jgi:hypothetical protein